MIFFNYLNQYLPEEKQKRHIIGAGFTILWVIVLIILGLVPAIQQALAAQEKYTLAQQQSDLLAESLNSIILAKQQVKAQTENMVLIEQALPQNPKPVTFVNEIDLAVAVNNLVLISLDYELGKSANTNSSSDSGETALGQTLAFTLRVDGEYAQLRELIQHLESIPRWVEIELIEIQQAVVENGDRETSTTPRLSLTINGVGYFNP